MPSNKIHCYGTLLSLHTANIFDKNNIFTQFSGTVRNKNNVVFFFNKSEKLSAIINLKELHVTTGIK